MLPVAKLSARARAGAWRGVRFLCYHSVVDEPSLTPLSQLTPVVSTAGFRRHLELMRSRAYTIVSMTDALQLIESGLGGRGQYVCVTFDDGRLDNFLNAWPILREFNATAHFFVSTGLIGASVPSVRNGYVDRFLTVEQLRTMLAEGASIGSHGRSHRDLTTLDARTIGQELAGSRCELEAMVGVPVLSYAYAYARYDRRVLQQMRSAGYRHGFTINTGAVARADEVTRFTLSRNVIRSGADEPENALLIQGGLDFARPYSTLKRRLGVWR
jgi:peptidoglycan/xylan/chitin deacetylase (PgdA/CDA1 family)